MQKKKFITHRKIMELPEEEIPCPNFEFCVHSCPQWVFDCHRGTCLNCGITFNSQRLSFTNFEDPIDCPICLDSKHNFIKHPAGCGHEMCRDCFRETWCPKLEVILNPRDWGFHTDCQCEGCTHVDNTDYCDNAMNVWKRNEPERYWAWLNEQDRQEMELKLNLEQRADCRACPICRAYFE